MSITGGLDPKAPDEAVEVLANVLPVSPGDPHAPNTNPCPRQLGRMVRLKHNIHKHSRQHKRTGCCLTKLICWR